MAIQGNPYRSGYDAAYREIYAVLADEDHKKGCDERCGCGVIKETIEILMEVLAGKLTQDEFFSLAIVLNRTHTRVKDSDGNISIDWWGELNNAVNTDGTYDWPEHLNPTSGGVKEGGQS